MTVEGKELRGAVWSSGVRDEIYDHVFADLDHEVGGFLVGALEPDGRLGITAAYPATAADGSTASLTFTQQAWADIHGELERFHPDEQIVGWYHSHPGFGIFLSEHDLFIHRNFFSNLRQVAYVIDPHAGREGLFGWRAGVVVVLSEGKTPRAAEKPAPRVVAEAGAVRRGLPPQRTLLAVAAALIVGLGGGLLLLDDGGGSSKKRAAPPGAPSVKGRAARPHGSVRRP